LLKKTPTFYQQVTRERLQNKFNRAYRYFEVLYDGQNPYIQSVKNNIRHLVRVLKAGNWALLRRSPPFFLGEQGADEDMDQLVDTQLNLIPKGLGTSG
jgi:hypothetical protein